MLLLTPTPLLAALAAIFSFIVALVVVSRQPQRTDNLAFFALIALTILGNLNAASLFFSGVADPYHHLQFRVVVALGGFSLFALVIFAQAFPLNHRPHPLLFWSLALASTLHAGWILSPALPAATWAEASIGLTRLYFGTCLLLTVYFVVRNDRALASSPTRRAFRFFHAVMAVRFILAGVALGAPRGGGRPAELLLILNLIVTPPLFAALLGYGLMRFQLLDPRVFVSRSLAWFAVSVGALGVFIAGISVIQRYLERLIGLEDGSLLTAPLAAAMLLTAFHPTRKRLERFFERRFNPELTQAREAAQRYFEESRGQLTLPALVSGLSKTVQQVLPGAELALLLHLPEARPPDARPPEARQEEDSRGERHRLMRVSLSRARAPLTGGPGSDTGAPSLAAEGRPLEPPAQGCAPPGGDPEEGYLEEVPAPQLEPLLDLLDTLPDSLRHLERCLDYATLEKQAALRASTAQVILPACTHLLPFWEEGHVAGAILLHAPNAEQDRLELLSEVSRHLGLQWVNARLFHEALGDREALVSANRALEETRSYLESILESVPAGIVVLSQDGRVVVWNKTMERLSGIPRVRALDVGDLTRLLPDLTLGMAGPQVTRAGFTSPLKQRLTLNGSQQETIVHLRFSLFRDRRGSAGGSILILTDVTEQVSMQAALEESKRLAALGQLAAAMAHEIRTPLTSIQLNVQILSGKLMLEAEDQEYFDIVLREIDRLNRTVGEILDFARPMKLEVTELDLAELVDDISRGLLFLLAERGVEVERDVAPGLVLEADGERLRQVLINLMDNASHAMQEDPARRPGGTREQEPALLRISGGHKAGPGGLSGVQLELADRGCGISAETLSHIFEPFYTTRARGTGLGLPIAKKIVELHLGTLEAVSTVGEGTTFRMWLPVRRSSRV